MTLLEKEFYTDKEVIEILIEYGYSTGSEFETAIWKERGALKKGSSTHKAVLRKLECIFENVFCEGKESERKYFLSGLKEQPIKDMGGNIGRRATSNDFLMDEYIFNQLLKVKGLNMSRSYSKWVRELDLNHKFSFYGKGISDMLYKLNNGSRESFTTTNIRDEFLSTLTTRNIDVVSGAFERLDKAGRIKVIPICNVKRPGGKYDIVSEIEYEKITTFFNEFLASEDTTVFKYHKLRVKRKPTEKEIELLNLIKEELEFHDIDFFYKSYEVRVIDKTIHAAMTREEYDTAYFDRLITLTEHRQNEYDKKESPFFWQKYYKLNTFAILRKMGVVGLDKAIDEELKKHPIMAFETTHSLDLTEIF